MPDGVRIAEMYKRAKIYAIKQAEQEALLGKRQNDPTPQTMLETPDIMQECFVYRQLLVNDYDDEEDNNKVNCIDYLFYNTYNVKLSAETVKDLDNFAEV